MTVPGGVPNLPTGALTIDTLASATQDTSPEAMKSRAVGRFSPIFDSSTGGSPANDLTPYGVIVKLFAGFNSLVANADPADIQGPEDLPQLLVNFVESLPLVGQFVDLNDAVLGNYEGDDETLLAIQAFFVGIRADVAQAQANADAAADKWAQSIDQLLGAGHGVEDFINMLQGLRDGNLSVLAPANTNRLDNPNFTGALSLSDPSGDFVWDAAVSRTAGAGSGSARATADGNEKELRSNKVSVAAGQVWTFVANIASVGLVGSGSLVQLTALPFDSAGNELPPVVLASSGVPTGTGVWVLPPAGANKTAQLTSDWTVPADVTRVSLRMVLTENATGGSIWLDDMSLAAKNPIPQDWVKNLVADLNTAFTRFAQMGQILSGQIITAYDDFVQDFKDWWAGQFGPAAIKAKADQNAAWAARKAQNDKILNDWSFYYPFGSSTDTAATLVGGKRTRWGAWNDNIAIILEQTGISPPTAPLVDAAGQAQLTAMNAATAKAAADLAQATNQDLTNKIIGSQTGVEPANGTAAQAKDALQNIPASNIQGQQGADVTYGSAGTVGTGGNSGITFTHTPAATDTMIEVVVGMLHVNSATFTSVISSSVSGDGTPVLVKAVRSGANASGNIVTLETWRIPISAATSPPSRTITVTPNRTGGNSSNVYMTGSSVSYYASKVASSNSSTGAITSSTLTQTASSSAGKRVIFIFAGLAGSGTLSWGTASGATLRSRFNETASAPPAFWIGDAAGASSVTASVATNQSSGQWVGITVELSN